MIRREQPPGTHVHLSCEGVVSRCILHVRHAAWLIVGGVLQVWCSITVTKAGSHGCRRRHPPAGAEPSNPFDPAGQSPLPASHEHSNRLQHCCPPVHSQQPTCTVHSKVAQLPITDPVADPAADGRSEQHPATIYQFPQIPGKTHHVQIPNPDGLKPISTPNLRLSSRSSDEQ
ncbi:hypothetical protein ACLOJK_024092 [Asimina triloba]